MDKKYKISVTGSHSCGKTTLCFHLAYLLKRKGLAVNMFTEAARRCPYPLRLAKAAEYIIEDHVLGERKALEGHKVLICDRTSIDSLLYAKAHGNVVRPEMVELAEEHLKTYDLIIHLKPSGPVVDDGFRCLDEGFRGRVARLFTDRFGRGHEYDRHYIPAEILESLRSLGVL